MSAGQEAAMQFRVLGPLEVETDGRSIRLGGPRQRQLLALLLMHSGEAVSADRLADELWSGSPPETARHTLQSYVHRLRNAFGPDGGRLESTASGYELKASPGEVDALRFEELADEARRALSAADPQRARDLLGEALGLWRGSVLSDLPDLAALEPARARWEGLRLAALEDRVEADLALGRHAALAAELKALVAEHSLRERLWGQLMLSLYRSGRQGDALGAFRRAREILAEELGIDPGPWLTELHGQILLQDPALSAPQPEHRRRPPHNLPAPRTSFVGRHQELAAVQGVVRLRRLLTITGPPGTGKTRLAIEVARADADDYPHGVFLVSLADIEDPELVPSLVAAAVGVPASEQPLTAALIEHLRFRRVLLVLDNFEHVLAGAGLVSRLLDAASGVTVLATSRTALRLYGEQEYPLGPLPPASREEVAADPAGADALVLFADRARAVDPAFTLTIENAPVVAEVVVRLDGLPLAIELAASRLRSLSLAELHERLGPVLPQLVEGPVDHAARQRTLRDAIAWSHDLLDPLEQAAFRRLAVFRGGFALDAAEAVAGGPPIEDLTGAITRLVDASLLDRPVGDGPARYSMLETIREYGVAQLQAAGEADEVAQRHAEFYAAFVERAEPALTGSDQQAWLERLSAEHPNLRAALAWARRGEAGELGLLMAGRLWRFWQLRGHLPEGRHWLESLLEATGDAASVPRVKALIGLAWTCYWLADLDAAAVRFRQALALVERDDDFLLRAEALLGQIVTLACHRGQVKAAVPMEKDLLALAAQHQHPALALMGHVASGTIRRFSGDLEGARSHALEGAALTRAAGDRWWEGEALRALGQISYEQGRHDEADEHLRASLGIAWEIGHHTGVAIDLNWLGLVAIARGRPAHGVVLAGAAARLRETLGGAFTVQDYRASMQQPQHAARRLLTESDIDVAWARGRAMRLDEAVGYARTPDERDGP